MQHALSRLVVVCLAALLLNTPAARADVAVLTPSADTSLFDFAGLQPLTGPAAPDVT